MSILVGSLTKFVKLYNCIISLRTGFFFHAISLHSEKYLEFVRECIPTKTITIRDRDKLWFNSGIKREMKICDSLHKKMRKQPNTTTNITH
jgi:hypothetical protein